jgi:hypothetical protein
MRVLRLFACVPAWMAAVLCGAWAFGAIYFDFPVAGPVAAILFVLVLLAAIVFVRRKLLKLAIAFGAFVLVASWWLTLKPSNDRAWQPDVAQTAWAQLNGDEVTVHNVRNCDYCTDTNFTPHWETRTVQLSQITGMDVATPSLAFCLAMHSPCAFPLKCARQLDRSTRRCEGFIANTR